MSSKNLKSNILFFYLKIKFYNDFFFRLYREMQITHGTTAERWAAGKLSRPQFVDAEMQITKKKNDLSGKMTQIINTI